MNKTIEEYSTKERLSWRDLNRFKAEVIKREAGELQNTKVVFFFLPNNCFNAAVFKVPFYNRYFILVNIFHIIRKWKDPIACLFIVYRSIVHELTHIFLLKGTQYQTLTDYRSLLANWEQWLDCNDSIFVRMMRTVRMIGARNDILSMAEQKCIRDGIVNAFEVFEPYMRPDFKKMQKGVSTATSFLYEHMEITHYDGGTVINQFASLVHRTQKSYKRIGKICPWTEQFFYPNGLLKPIDQLYLERTEANSDVYDEIILRSFLNLEFDFSAMFEKFPALKEHVQVLSNRQLEKNVQYMENYSVAGVFLEKEILSENTRMILLDSNRLNMLMRKYGLKHTGRTLYSI